MSITGVAKTGLNYMGRLLFDDNFATTVTSRLKASQRLTKANGGKWYSNFHNRTAEAFVTAEKRCARNGGILDGLKRSIKTFLPDTKAIWKSSGTFGSKLKGTLGQLGKRLPLIGTALMVAFELPNIYKATKDGGLVNGAIETGKSAVRLGAGIALGAIGGALLGPIGSIAGFFIGDCIGKLVVGKSYSEKEAEKEEQIAQAVAEAQAQATQPTFTSNPETTAAQNTTATNPMTPTMTPEQLAQLQNTLYNTNNYNDDIMFNTLPKINYQA